MQCINLKTSSYFWSFPHLLFSYSARVLLAKRLLPRYNQQVPQGITALPHSLSLLNITGCLCRSYPNPGLMTPHPETVTEEYFIWRSGIFVKTDPGSKVLNVVSLSSKGESNCSNSLRNFETLTKRIKTLFTTDDNMLKGCLKIHTTSIIIL